MPPDLIRVIPYGISRPSSADASAARLALEFAPNGELLIGMVVAPDPSADVGFKGHNVLLEAISAAGQPGLRAVFVGHDPGPDFRKRAAALQIEEAVAIGGHVADVAPYIRAFDLLVVPSTRFESLPLVVLEAMALGTPVIASRLAGIPEAVTDGENGYTFRPGDVRALAELLRHFAESREQLEALGRGALATFESHFLLERMVERIFAFYAEVTRLA